MPRRALLDTSLVIDFPAVLVAEVADEVAVSAVTIGELQYGVSAAPDPLTQMYRRRRVQAILDRFEVLSFDVAAAEYYGTPAALVRQYGRNPRPRRMGLQIRQVPGAGSSCGNWQAEGGSAHTAVVW